MSNKKKFEKIKLAKQELDARLTRVVAERDELRQIVSELYELYDLDNVSVVRIDEDVLDSEVWDNSDDGEGK